MFVMQLNPFKRFPEPLALLGVGGLAAMASVALGVAQPVRAANVTCQAINATSIIGGSIPSGACYDSVNAGDSWEIDLSNIFAANSGSLPLNNSYSLQIANLNTGPSNTLTFSDVEFLVSGTTGSALNNNLVTFTDQAITVWANSAFNLAPAFPFAQGLGGYVTHGSTSIFGMMNVASQASFTLNGPVTAGTPNIGTAALLSTFPVDLQAAGITSFTGAKIRGIFGGSSNSVNAFSAGLARFAGDPFTTSPTAIYGNAFNVPVPGPLPIVGAGAAFGWSRKLRRRIGASKAAA